MGAPRELGLFLPVARLVGLRCSRSLRYCCRIGWLFIPYKKPKAVLTPPGFPVENRFPGHPATWPFGVRVAAARWDCAHTFCHVGGVFLYLQPTVVRRLAGF